MAVFVAAELTDRQFNTVTLAFTSQGCYYIFVISLDSFLLTLKCVFGDNWVISVYLL